MKIFVSFASEQRELAERLAVALRSQGHSVFSDRDELPGYAIDASLRRQIHNSDLFLFLVTPESVARGRYTRTELETARRRWPDPSGRVLPVLVQPVAREDLPPLLRAVSFLEPQGDPVGDTVERVERLMASRRARRRRAWTVAAVVLLVATGGAAAYLHFAARAPKTATEDRVGSANPPSRPPPREHAAAAGSQPEERMASAANPPPAEPVDQQVESPEQQTETTLEPVGAEVEPTMEPAGFVAAVTNPVTSVALSSEHVALDARRLASLLSHLHTRSSDSTRLLTTQLTYGGPCAEDFRVLAVENERRRDLTATGAAEKHLWFNVVFRRRELLRDPEAPPGPALHLLRDDRNTELSDRGAEILEARFLYPEDDGLRDASARVSNLARAGEELASEVVYSLEDSPVMAKSHCSFTRWDHHVFATLAKMGRPLACTRFVPGPQARCFDTQAAIYRGEAPHSYRLDLWILRDEERLGPLRIDLDVEWNELGELTGGRMELDVARSMPVPLDFAYRLVRPRAAGELPFTAGFDADYVMRSVSDGTQRLTSTVRFEELLAKTTWQRPLAGW